MRRLLFAVCVLTVIGCDAVSRVTGIGHGTIRFVRDANTCGAAYPVSYDFFVDGSQIGTKTLNAGDAAEYSVASGDHLFSARVANTAFTFSQLNATVSPGQTTVYTMTC